MKTRVEFKLSMPQVGSWNGKWSGRDRNYIIYKSLSKETTDKLFGVEASASWYYNFGDGWGASVAGRIVAKGEKKNKSDGFCGYDWMVDSIIKNNIIKI